MSCSIFDDWLALANQAENWLLQRLSHRHAQLLSRMLKWALGANELFPSEKVKLAHNGLKTLAQKP